MALIVSQELRDFIFDSTNKILELEDGLEDIEKVYFESYNIENVEEELLDTEKTYFRISQISLCPRKEYYRNKGYKQYIDSQSYLTLAMGNDIHRRIQSLLKSIGILKSKEEKLVLDMGNYNIVGHYDGIINWNGNDSLIEIKTMSPYALQKTLKEVATIEMDYSKMSDDMTLTRYLKQANTYLFLLNEIKHINLFGNMHWLIFVNKASVKGVPPLFTLQFTYDPILKNDVLDKAKEIYNFVVKNEEPPAKDDWECIYCGYINCPFNRRLRKNGSEEG